VAADRLSSPTDALPKLVQPSIRDRRRRPITSSKTASLSPLKHHPCTISRQTRHALGRPRLIGPPAVLRSRARNSSSPANAGPRFFGPTGNNPPRPHYFDDFSLPLTHTTSEGSLAQRHPGALHASTPSTTPFFSSHAHLASCRATVTRGGGGGGGGGALLPRVGIGANHKSLPLPRIIIESAVAATPAFRCPTRRLPRALPCAALGPGSASLPRITSLPIHPRACVGPGTRA
jgi:hypothetical protein